MPTIKQTLDTYQHKVSQIEGGLTALDLWARRIGLWQNENVDTHLPQPYTRGQITIMADKIHEDHWHGDAQPVKSSCPLKLGLPDQKEEQYFSFRIDPVIAVSGGNQIATRHVAKSRMRGTIKESWAQDDWKIDIRGVLVGSDADDLAVQMQALCRLLDADQTLCVVCPYLQGCYTIDRLVVQSYSFPATKGLRFQQVQLSCLSDEDYDLF